MHGGFTMIAVYLHGSDLGVAKRSDRGENEGVAESSPLA